ncbi:hypothetical protein UCRNP2_9422 [Neofusicoccum parvum UCRNP2]|uniref:Uncharacterized protein n=1 Tax=Botryosphaeria parva (strain UCR-NP2) TaxID=1287680 RepID=R1E8W6_BOTPV|nr:hypothetical protein UCRNP2_9422 [Neofusicoccum parvum UCRNP2]
MASVNCGTTSDPRFCLAALDPETLEPLGQWEPTDRNVVSNYWQIIDNRISVPTQEGFIVELERSGNSFNVIREIDVSGHLPQGSILAQVGYTGDGNLWFAATPVPLLGLDGTNTTTVGYAAADDSLHAISIVDELFENAFAVNGNSIYVVTGPAGPKDTPNANGQFYAFQAGATDGVTVVYNETYSAGSGFKPGGLSRGSGASVGLLGQKYVAITDNADVQVNLVVYRQAEEAALAGSAFACSIPLFQPNASGNEAGLTTHFDGSTYSALIINSYGSRTFLDQSSSDINGPQNNNSAASPGITRINVSDDGTCSLAWDLPIVGTMTTLSTETGILYAYLQDMDLAVKGEYVYYFAAIDWATGEEMWRAKAGAGGVFNPGISHVQLGPNGRLYQGVAGGVAWMEDAPTAASVLRYLGF